MIIWYVVSTDVHRLECVRTSDVILVNIVLAAGFHLAREVQWGTTGVDV